MPRLVDFDANGRVEVDPINIASGNGMVHYSMTASASTFFFPGADLLRYPRERRRYDSALWTPWVDARFHLPKILVAMLLEATC